MKKQFFLLIALLFVALGSWAISPITKNVPGDYSTIQAAINAASPGDIIQVAAGTYSESLTVNKSVTLQGANAGVHPAVGTHPTATVGTRGAETILSNSFAISPAADNITIDGFKFTGAGGRIIDTYSNANGFHLTNCIFNDNSVATTQGVIQFGGGSHTNCVFEYNLFKDKGDHTFYAGGGPFDNLKFQYNKFQSNNDAIFWAATALTGGVIDHNEFDGESGSNYNNINIGLAGNLQITNNYFHDIPYTAIQCGIINGAITGNKFENYVGLSGYNGAAIQLWGGEWGTPVSSNVTITGNEFHYNQSAVGSIYGIRLRGPNSPTDPKIDGTTIHVNNNTFFNGGSIGTAYAILYQGDQTKTLDATCNWFASESAQTVYQAPGATGTVNYIPYNVSNGGACVGGYTVKNNTQNTWYATIQAAINAANANDVINVYPGNYNETAANSSFNSATYQFGLFFSSSKSNITVQGVKADGTPITNTADIAAFITTNATNTFGYAGTFVVGNNITLRGLQFDSNTPSDDKAIEVLGNGFTLDACRITANAPVYIGDYNYNTNGTPSDFSDDVSSIQSYTITNCHFAVGDVYIANGTGWTGATPASVTGRSITGCTFEGWAMINFSGYTPGTAWLNYPTGAATITGNTFVNTDPGNTRYIQSWGAVQAEFPYASYWNNNTFPKKTLTTTDGNANHVRGYDVSPYFNLKRIGNVIQPRITNAQAGDVVLVGAGIYPENLSFGKSITILGPNATTSPNGGSRATEAILQPLQGSDAIIPTANSINVVLKGVTVDMGSTVEGNRYLTLNSKSNTGWNFEKNIFKNAQYSDNGSWWFSGSAVSNLTLNDNYFTANAVSNGLMVAVGCPAISITNNVWENNGYTALNLNAVVGTISGNTFRDTRTVNFSDPNYYFGDYQSGILLASANNNLSISGNTFTNVHYGVVLYQSADGTISVTGNHFNGTLLYSVRLSSSQSGGHLNNVTVSGNSFLNYAGSNPELSNARTDGQVLNATCNWFGTTNANLIAPRVDPNITYSPYSISDGGACTGTPVVIASANVAYTGCSQGSITVTFSGGTSPYTVALNGGTPAAYTSGTAITGLAPNTYSIVVTDANGTTATSSATINDYKVKNHNTGVWYATIQAAITAATAGDEIDVCSGTYTENFGIDKGIKLYGANYNVSPNTGTRVDESIITTNFRIGTTDPVQIKGFEFTYPGSSNTIDQYVSGNVVLEKNYFYQAAGLFFANPANISIIDNLCSFSVQGNEGIFIAGNYNGTTGTYSDIHDNVFMNSQNTGFNLSSVHGIIYNNIFDNINYYGVIIANTCNLDIYQNTFSNIINPNPSGSATWGAGVRFYQGFESGMTANIHNNTFTNNYNGIGARPASNFTGTNVNIHNNTFSGNTNYNIINQGTGTLDATCNWFGTSSYAAAAAKISGKVDIHNILANSTLISTDPAYSCAGGIAIPANLVVAYDAANKGVNVNFDLSTSEILATPTTADPAVMQTLYTNLFTAMAGSNAAAKQAAAFALGDDIITEYYYYNGSTKTYLLTTGGSPLVKSKYWDQYLVRVSDGARFPKFSTSSYTLNPTAYLTYTNSTLNGGATVNAAWLDAALGRDVYVTVTVVHNGNITSVTDHVAIPTGPIVNTNTGFGYPTIQAAIDASATLAGHTITVAAGTYNELVSITKAITLLGPNAAIAGNGSRVPEAVLQFPTGVANGENLIYAGSNLTGVTIAGFDLRCQDATIPQYHNLIYTEKINNLTIRNNRMYSSEVPMYILTDNSMTDYRTGMLIEGNYVDCGPNVNNRHNRGIYVEATSGTIQDNQFLNTNIGIQYMPYGHTTSGLIQRNIVSAGLIGLYHNYQTLGAAQVTWSQNEVSAAPNPQTGLSAQVDGAWTTPTTFRGIHVITFGTQGTGSSPSVTFQNNKINAANPGGTTSTIFRAVYLSNTSAGTVTLSNNSFTNYTNGIVRNTDATTTTVNATCNWWGTAANADVTAAASSATSYNPWLINGTDNSSDIGFQPVSGACTGTPVVIASATPANTGCSLGSITVTFSGGTAPYTIALNGGAATTYTSGTAITGLTPNTYSIVITDANGSTATTSATINDYKAVNHNTGVWYASIQSAITAATAGDEIDVCAGTFDISSVLNITKGITLKGANAGIPGTGTRNTESILVDSRTPATNGGAFTIGTTSAVVIDGFTFQGSKIITGQPANALLSFLNNRMILQAMPNSGQTSSIYSTGCVLTLDNNYIETTGFNASNSALLQVAGGYTGTGSSDMMTMTNNYFKGIPVWTPYNNGNGQGLTQLNFSECQGTVSGNTFDGVDIGVIIAGSCGNMTVSSNTFKNIHRDPVQDVPNGTFGAGVVIFLPSYVSNITISGNTFQNSDCGIRTSYMNNGETGSHIIISDNTFSGNTFDISNKFSDLTLSLDGSNTMGGTTLSAATTSQLFSIEDKILHKVDYSNYGLVIYKANNTYVTVNSYFTPAGTTTPSIQRGIDVAAIGTTVNVGPGTYNENFGINKGIKLYGANYNVSPVTGTRTTESIITTNFRIGTTDPVQIKGFEFTYPGGSNTIDQYASGTVVLEKNYFNNVTGLFFANPANFSIIDNLCTFNANAEGIFIAGNYDGTNGTYADIHNNKFVGGEATGFNLSSVHGIIYNNIFDNINYYGVLIANTCNLDIYQNTFENIINPNPSGSATWGAGVRFYEGFSSGLTANIHNNTFTNNYNGISAKPACNFTGTNVSINNNNISGNTNYNILNQGTGTLSSTCNWYGTSNGNTIASKISGSVTYSPWLTSGGNSASIGFTPTGSCAGTPVVVTLNTLTSPICPTTNTGAIDINVSGGSGSYTYAWSNSATSQDLTSVPAGSYTVTVTDATYGSTATLTQVLINTNTVPAVSNPGAQTASTSTGMSSTTVTYTATASGTPTPSLSYAFTGATTGNGSGNGSGSTFNQGVTNVTVTSNNGCSPNATATFTVTVSDNENPTISCVGTTQYRNVASGTCAYAAVAAEFNPTSFADNCPGATVSYVLSGATIASGNTSLTGYSFNKGTTNVLWTVTDASSNTNTCSFNVVISDPSGIYVNDANSTGDIYTFGIGSDVSGDGSKCSPYATITKAITVATSGATIYVDAGTFNEDVTIGKSVSLIGAGYLKTTVSGIIGGTLSTMYVGAPAVVIDGFMVTRDGNNTTDWNNSGLNTAGIAVQSQGNYAEVRNCKVYGNRTGVDINNSNGNYIHNNIIDNNRTGMIFRNQTDNSNVQENFITNNWKAGVLFLDASSGTNSPVQTAANSTFNNNSISGNWYGDIVDRQIGGSLLAPGLNMKNFECNWYGTTSPLVSTANSTEPVYAAQIPVLFGGSSVAPGGQPNILGPASANIDYMPYLINSTDNSSTMGFQPVPGSCTGSAVVVTFNSSTNTGCPGSSTGSININVSGGSGNFTYLWSPGAYTTKNISGIPAGSYNVTVTDVSNSSTASLSAAVTVGTNYTVPAVSNPGAQTANALSNTCATTVSYTATPTGTPTPSLTYAFSGATSGSGSGSGSGSSFNKGVTNVVVTASNGCSSNATASFTITVSDNQNPLISCPANQSRSLSALGNYVAVGTEFNPTFSDNCTGSTIAYTLSGSTTGSGNTTLAGVTFNGGTTLVTWTVTDASSRTATCSFNVVVALKISGTIRYANNANTPLDGVIVTLKKTDDNSTVGTPCNTSLAGQAGTYQFTSGVQTGVSYYIVVSSVNSGGAFLTWGGVNSTDYLLEQRHATGTPSLQITATPAVRRLAGDVKDPKTPPVIVTADVNAVRVAYTSLSYTTAGFENPRWVFTSDVAVSPATGLTGITLPTGSGNLTLNIVGSCAGDVDGSYLPPSGNKAPQLPNVGLINRGSIAASKEIAIPVRAESNMLMGAVSLILDYDAENFEITGITMPNQGTEAPFFAADNNTVRIGWASLEGVNVNQGETVLTIHARAKSAAASTLHFALNNNPLSEIADPEGVVLMGAQLSIADMDGSISNDMLSVYPNPAKEVLNIEYIMDNDGAFRAELYDIQGALVCSTLNSNKLAGSYKEKINISNLATGVYTLRVYNGNNINNQKVIISK